MGTCSCKNKLKERPKKRVTAKNLAKMLRKAADLVERSKIDWSSDDVLDVLDIIDNVQYELGQCRCLPKFVKEKVNGL